MLSARIPFAGFYQSIWSDIVDQYVEQYVELHDEQINAESIYDHLDFRQAYTELAKLYAEAFAKWLGETLDRPVEHEFEELTSPRFYNFETDKIFVRLPEAVLQAVLDDLRSKDQETLERTFRDRFTSRDGFISFYSSDVPSKPINEWDHNELHALLAAWIKHQGVGDLDLELYDGVYERSYPICDAAVDWDAISACTAD
jgi:hypothetical protein